MRFFRRKTLVIIEFCVENFVRVLKSQILLLFDRKGPLICKWLDLNNMHLHPQRTKVMAFGHRKKLLNDVLLLKYKSLPIENV